VWICVGVREPVAVAGPGFPVVCVLFACCAEFHVVCVFARSVHFSTTEVAYRIALLLFPLHYHFTSCASIWLDGRNNSLDKQQQILHGPPAPFPSASSGGTGRGGPPAGRAVRVSGQEGQVSRLLLRLERGRGLHLLVRTDQGVRRVPKMRGDFTRNGADSGASLWGIGQEDGEQEDLATQYAIDKFSG